MGLLATVDTGMVHGLICFETVGLIHVPQRGALAERANQQLYVPLSTGNASIHSILTALQKYEMGLAGEQISVNCTIHLCN